MTAMFVRTTDGELINLAFVRRTSEPKKYSNSDSLYYDVRLDDDTMYAVDADELNDTLQDTVGFVPAQPGTYLVDYVDGKMKKEAPIVGWKICDSGSTAKPISPVWTWWLNEKRCLKILFPDGRVDDIYQEQRWNSVAEFEKEMAAEAKATTKEAVNEPA